MHQVGDVDQKAEARETVDALRGRSDYELGLLCTEILQSRAPRPIENRKGRRCRWCGNGIAPDAPAYRMFCRDVCIQAKQDAMVRANCEHLDWVEARDAYGEFERCARCGMERTVEDRVMAMLIALFRPMVIVPVGEYL